MANEYRRVVVALAFAFAMLSNHSARAQTPNDEFGIERFRIAMDGAGILDVDWANVPGHGSWGLGVWTGFAHSPLVLYDPAMAPVGALVGQRVTTGLVGSVALWNRIELALAADATDYQATSGMVDAATGADALPSSGFGDLRVAVKLLLVGGSLSRFHLAIIPAMTLPMGPAGGYLRETGPTFIPELAVAWDGGVLRLAANVGYRVRQRVTVADLVVDDEVFTRAGIGVRVAGTRDDVFTELDASVAAAVGTDPTRNTTAIEAMIGGSQRLSRSTRLFVVGGVGLDKGFGTPDWRAVIGIRIQGLRGDRDGDGIADRVDLCPDEPEDRDGFQDSDGCPDPDNDRDGIVDTADKCPDQPEDKDGFQDSDGCPDPDNDGDGIADALDKCPDQPEDKDGDRDTDGCPDPDGKLQGRIVDADQRPIPAAAVVIEQLDHPARKPIELAAADDGSFTVAVASGGVKISARANGYRSADTVAKVADGQSVPVVIALARVVRQGQLRGQILSFNGKPLAATISISGAPAQKVTADAEGMFAVDLPEGTFDVVVEAPGHIPQRRSVNVKVERVTVVNVDMRRGK